MHWPKHTASKQARNELFSFNRQLAGFKDTLIEFLSEVLESDRYATAVLVRGLYFTSVYQQGTTPWRRWVFCLTSKACCAMAIGNRTLCVHPCIV